MIEQATIVKILPTTIWIESDILGARHVMLQHEGMDPFRYCSFHYNYAYTGNSQTLHEAETMAKKLGATDPIEHRHSEFKQPTLEELREELAAIQELIAYRESEE